MSPSTKAAAVQQKFHEEDKQKETSTGDVECSDLRGEMKSRKSGWKMSGGGFPLCV